ncbi:MAG: hypothetical protein ACI8TS_002025, partial [Flavobacteriales bacterium]
DIALGCEISEVCFTQAVDLYETIFISRIRKE